MPLPSYAPRSDSFGNWYFGGFQVDSSVEPGYGAGTSLTPTQSDFNTFLNSALGSTSWSNSTTAYSFRFNNSYEQLTGTVTQSANHRFNVGTGTIWGMNTSPTGRVMMTEGAFGISNLWAANRCSYAVANQYGMWICYANNGASAGTLSTSVFSLYIGWAKDPVFPTNTTERVRNLVMGAGTAASGSGAFVVTGAADSSGNKQECFTNSVISCSVSTPGANVSDLCFLNSDQSYLNIGSAYNAVFCPGSGLTVGQIYRIPPSSDPDGNTEQNIWLCAGQVYGWNGSAGVANAGYKLIRVWSNNIT